jgi:hypothetical protein
MTADSCEADKPPPPTQKKHNNSKVLAMISGKARTRHQLPGRWLKVWGFRVALAAIVGQALLIPFTPSDPLIDGIVRVSLFGVAFVAVIAREVGGNLASKRRALSAKNIGALTERMKRWAVLPAGIKRQSAAVFATSSTFEAAALADQIAKALGDAGWSINRHPVMYGEHFVVPGVALLIASNDRALAISVDLIAALQESGVAAGLLSRRRRGCEEMGKAEQEIADEPWCSSISVIVGDKP